MASPELVAASTRTKTEQEVRECALAMRIAKDKWEAFYSTPSAPLTDEQWADREIAKARALEEFLLADSAFRRCL